MTAGNNRTLLWPENAVRVAALRQIEFLPLQGRLRHATLHLASCKVASSGAHH
jgi:hypothetical protein